MDYEQKYEQKYREALGWMRSLYDGLHGTTKEDAEHYFPELKESEDERIRKGLIKAVSGILKGNTLYGTDVTREEALAWLEKQDKTLDADDVIAWLVANICDFEYYVKRFKEDFELC